ncbi:hypothetical protein Dimus_012702, partial [Dionaea muscipula]
MLIDADIVFSFGPTWGVGMQVIDRDTALYGGAIVYSHMYLFGCSRVSPEYKKDACRKTLK